MRAFFSRLSRAARGRTGRTPSRPPAPLRLWALGGGLTASVALWCAREPLQARWLRAATLAHEAPPSSMVEEMIAQASDPVSAVIAAWNTGKVVHRDVAMREIARRLSWKQPESSELDPILLAGALDPDSNVREAALGTLAARGHPDLPALAVHQLGDPDPERRRLGLDQLRRARARSAFPAVIRLVDDPSPEVAALAIHTAGRWAGVDFGVRLADAVPVQDPASGDVGYRPESLANLRAGAARVKAWWQDQPDAAREFLPEVPPRALQALRPLPAGDFDLTALDGTPVRLSALRGKVVVLNFWTTWCTACLAELPVLIELRRRQGPGVVILGVSLDALPDGHGHVGGHGGEDDSHPAHAGHDEADDAHGHAHALDGPVSLAAIRSKVERMTARLGINYPVLLDARNDVGGRFNGGELPTTVIVDGEGNLRRRFVGARSIEVFEAMIADARAGAGFAGRR